jgi:mRNA interferase YafQ
MTRTERSSEVAGQFRRDYKAAVKSFGQSALDADLKPILALLLTDGELPASARDHALVGSWRGYRDVHIRPDLVLIYAKIGADTLQLARLASHSELDF